MKKILYLNRNFYIYDQAIKDCYIKMGYEVISYNLVPKYKFFDRIAQIKDYEKIEKRKAVIQQKEMICSLKDNNIEIDIVLVTSGQNLLVETLEELHGLYPQAVFVWHIWDSIKSVREYESNKRYFDHIISFDKIDAENYHLPCLPNFYIKEIQRERKKYDISFVGTEHSIRMSVLKKLVENKSDSSIYIYLLNGGIKALTRYIKIWKYWRVIKYLKLFPVDYEKVLEIMSSSRCILDIPYPEQTGLTSRPMEAMGVHAKLITTNKHIKEYDFYNPNNIYVIDLENIVFPDKEFITGKYEEVPDDILKKYRIDNWCEQLSCYFDK